MSRAERIASRNPVGRAVRSVRASAWCLLAAASTGIASCATAPSGPEPAPIAAESIEAPLVLPGTVEPSGSTLAAASLAEVRKALGTPPASAGGPPPREPIDAVEATRLYVRGRAAATEGRMLVAASELERAHDLDPGSAAILEELGRVQGRLGNARRAAECHELLLAIRPNDAEALFSSGVAAASRGDLPRAIERLATLYDLEPAARARGLQGFRGEARTIADLALARALVALGADAAAAGVLERADGEAPPDLPPSMRADLGITLGDALARTGNLPGAIAAWQGAIVDVPGAEIRGLPRLLWAAVRSGADREAMSMLSTAIAAGPPSDELVALARWFAQARPGAAAELAGRIDDRRLRAALLGPDRGRKLLAAAVADDPENAPIELLREWFAALETDTAIDEAMRLVAAHPARAEACASALVRSGATAGGLIAAVDRTEGRRGRGTLEPALAAALRDEARLARIADEVASGGGGPRELAATATAIARLGDESTVERLAARVDATVGITQATRSRILAALSEAARGAGASLRARELAERAVAAHRNPETISALARVRLDEALSRPVEDRGAILADALALIDEATADPRAPDSAWRLRLAVVDALGEPTKRGAVRAAIRANRPGSALDRQVTRDALVAEGRAAEAVDLAAIRAAAVPTDLDAFRFTIAAVPRTGQGERLRPWLLGRQVAMPAEPDSLEAHVALLLASGGEENALELLRRRASGVPPEPFAAALLERALVDRGRAREAWLAAKARRDAGMDASGVRGELRFAALSLEAGESATAAVTLETLAARAAELSPGAALAAARLAERLPADSDGRDRLASALGLAAARDPSPERLDASLLVARLAARRLERSGSETDRDDLRRAIALAIAAAATDAWREPSVEAFLAVAQGLADDEHHAAASELLATAVRDDPAMPAPVAGRLVVAACALDAVAGGRWERSLELVRLVRSRGARPFSNAGDPAEREAEAIHRLSGLYSFLDDRIGADRLLEVSLALEPDHAMSLNNLAYSAIDRGEIDAETVRRAERAHELMPADPSVLDTLGWLRYKQGRFRDDASGPGAIALIRRSIEARPDDPGLEPLDHLGDALWRAGDRNAAIRAWRAAAEILPRRHPVDSILNGLPEYERREQGVRLLDPREFWQRSYGDVGERAARKAATALAGGEPAVAPLAAAPPAP